MKNSEEKISFKLLGENFTVKSDVSKDYFLSLVEYLEKKLEEVKEKLPNLSNVKVVIFAALDIADELFRKKESTLDRDALKLITELSESLEAAIEEEEEEE
ncbi:MAG: cell division protein ZapA [Spirochaetota bacterium]|nr:MAG: cell division protein ZapA [Spirochaetota bacterium]